MGVTDIGFGCALIGTWFASLLTGVAFAQERRNLVLQAYRYFYESPNDGPLRRGLVATLVLLCCAALVGEYAEIYLPTVTHWGDVATLATEIWASPGYIIVNATAGLIVNTYLIHRFYSVSKNITVALVLGLLNLFAFIMSFLAPLMFGGVGHVRTLEDVQKIVPLSIVWSVTCAACDVSIAISLVWTLRGMRTTFKETDRLLRRVMVISIRNGCATSLASIGFMLATIIIPFSTISSIFLYMLAPLYLLSLLSNLRLRGSGKSGSRTWSSSRHNNSDASVVIKGIQVHHATHITNDPTASEMELTRKGQDDDGSVHQKQDTGADGFRSQQIHFGADSA